MKKIMEETLTEAIVFQRNLAENEAIDSQNIIEAEGHKGVELTETEDLAFVQAVASQHEEARSQFGNTMFDMISKEF